MGNRVFAWAAAILGCVWAAAASAAPVFDVPQLDKIVIDGDATDWGALGFRVDSLTDQIGVFKPARDFDPGFRLGWDERGLLLLLTIRDNEFVEAESADELYLKDSIELFVAAEVGSPEYYQVVIAPGMDAAHAEVRWKAYDLRKPPAPAGSLTVSAARSKSGDRCRIEVLLPWKNLGIEPKPGRELGFALYFNDFDRAEYPGKMTYHATWYPVTMQSGEPWNMHRIRLSAEPTPARTSVAACHPAGFNPRVRVTGAAELAGGAVEILSDGRRVGSGAMQADGDKSLGEIVLPFPPPDRQYGRVEVRLEGKLLDTVRMPQAQYPRLCVVADGAAKSDGATSVKVAFAPAGDSFGSLTAEVEVFDPAGNRVERARCPVEGAVKLELKEGFYRVRARLGNFHGRDLEATGACYVGADPRAATQAAVKAARALKLDAASAKYAGGVERLASLAEAALKKEKADPRELISLGARLAECAALVPKGRNPLEPLRGAQEWAYRSKVDGTSQPYMVGIPTGYDPSRSWPLHVRMHGANGAYNSYGHEQYNDPYVVVWVMGRAPSMGYRALAEVDVLEVIENVKACMNIDPDRVHLTGGSMGGGGTYHLGSRHPDLFASARPMSGYGTGDPVENMLHVPTYAIHGTDDGLPVSESRAPVRLIAEAGGQAIMDEKDMIGHRSIAHTEAVERAENWAARLVRPAAVRRIHYTAIDELARGAYWIEATEWGPDGRPASLDARLGNDNALYLRLDNVKTARVRLAASPADRKSEMMISVNERVVSQLAAPLPDSLYVTSDGDGWRVSAEPPELPPQRLHFPGGAAALFHGEPILVVWGTRGTDEARKAMADAAQSARRSPGPPWRSPKDKNSQMTFAELPGKPDTEVTQEDMETHNLLLIGTAAQNAVVAKLAGGLPVTMDGSRIKTADGFSWDAKDRAVGLLYYNPSAPKRLIYWVGSESAAFYKPRCPLLDEQDWATAAPDLVVMHATQHLRVAARRFDSRWGWEKGYAESPLLPGALCTEVGTIEAMSNALRHGGAADLALIVTEGDPARARWAAGETRRMDVAAWEYDDRIAVMDLTAQEIADAAKKMVKIKDKQCRFVGEYSPQPGRACRVALFPWTIWDYAEATRMRPESYRLLPPGTMREAVQRHYEADGAK